MTKISVRGLPFITCFSALPLMVGLTGCAGDPYHQSPGHRIEDHRTADRGYNQTTDQGIEDSRTAERVREALAAGADYKYDRVKVTAFKGIVQLSGFVNTRPQKIAAEDIASNVMGVKDVVNNITVKE